MSSGLFGDFGQSNYAAAKLGVVGLARNVIRVNTIAPTAGMGMTHGLLSDAMVRCLLP